MIHYNIFDLKKKKIHIRMTLFRHFRFKGQTEKNLLKMSEASLNLYIHVIDSL